jgi:hypothetical protein
MSGPVLLQMTWYQIKIVTPTTDAKRSKKDVLDDKDHCDQ